MTCRGKYLEFDIKDQIGSGGNGTVYRISCNPPCEEELVVKILRPSYGKNPYPRKKYIRFKIEANINIELCKISNRFIPIRDYYLPSKPNRRKHPWFVMPYADTLKSKILNSKTIQGKLEIVLEIGHAIKDLHDNEYVHRDIKLDNVLFYDGRVVLCDFGLIRHPSLDRITGDTEPVGPWNTIAPEMKRVAAKFSTPKQADIYSFGKLMWIILTEDEHCFDGQYSRNDVMSLDRYFENQPLRILHSLLENMTRADYNKRPNIDEVLSMISYWLQVRSDEVFIKKEKQIELYEEIQKKYNPSKLIYSDIEAIHNILGELIEIHSIFCNQLDKVIKVISVQKSRIPHCLEIRTESSFYICKPKQLYHLTETNKWLIDIEDIEELELRKAGIEFTKKDKDEFLVELFRKTLNNSVSPVPEILKAEKEICLIADS